MHTKLLISCDLVSLVPEAESSSSPMVSPEIIIQKVRRTTGLYKCALYFGCFSTCLYTISVSICSVASERSWG